MTKMAFSAGGVGGGRSGEQKRQLPLGSETEENGPVLIRQKESYLRTKLANMLRAAERRPKRERDHELIATINRTIEDLKRQREQRGQRGRH